MIPPTPIPKSKLAGYGKLLQKKYRTKQRRFLIEGMHLVEEALASDWKIDALLVSRSFASRGEYPAIARKAAAKKVPVHDASDRELEKLSDTVTSQGIVGVVQERMVGMDDALSGNSRPTLLVALDSISDPGNLGTIIRTCDWFGVDAVWVNAGTVELYNPKVVRATMGSLFHVPIVVVDDLCRSLEAAKRKGFAILAAVVGGESILTLMPIPARSIILFGNEAHGLSPEVQKLASSAVAIPRFGKAESLNVAVSCAAMLTAFRLQGQ